MNVCRGADVRSEDIPRGKSVLPLFPVDPRIEFRLSGLVAIALIFPAILPALLVDVLGTLASPYEVESSRCWCWLAIYI